MARTTFNAGSKEMGRNNFNSREEKEVGAVTVICNRRTVGFIKLAQDVLNFDIYEVSKILADNFFDMTKMIVNNSWTEGKEKSFSSEQFSKFEKQNPTAYNCFLDGEVVASVFNNGSSVKPSYDTNYSSISGYYKKDNAGKITFVCTGFEC